MAAGQVTMSNAFVPQCICPTRREDYITVTKSTVFPLSFCAHRWVENLPVVERALAVWPSLRLYMEAMKTKRLLNPGTGRPFWNAVNRSVTATLVVVWPCHSFCNIWLSWNASLSVCLSASYDTVAAAMKDSYYIFIYVRGLKKILKRLEFNLKKPVGTLFKAGLPPCTIPSARTSHVASDMTGWHMIWFVKPCCQDEKKKTSKPEFMHWFVTL